MSEKLRERVEELEQKHRLLADNLLDALWVVDAKTHRFEYITPSIERISGYTADEYMSMTIEDMLSPESLTNALNMLAEIKAKFERGLNIVSTMEHERVNKDGSINWIETKTKFYQEKGRPLKIVGITRDINERKKTEQKQKELIEKLGKALVEKEKLLEENKILRGLLPICSGCKRIRDENNKWWPLDAYVTKKTDTKITHTICPDCREVYYGDL
jgi:PAS domain S-box-containing protein